MSNKVKIWVVGSLFFLGLLGGVMMGTRADEKQKVDPETSFKNRPKKKKKNPTYTYRRSVERPASKDMDRAYDDVFVKKQVKKEKYLQRTIAYSDPINDRVLGDPRWAATNSQQELEKVEKAFEHKVENPDIKRFSRQRSIDRVKAVVHGCFADLKKEKAHVKGRIIVEWIAEKEGKISSLKLGPNVDLRYDSFTNCILTRTKNLTFKNEGEDLFITYPFALN